MDNEVTLTSDVDKTNAYKSAMEQKKGVTVASKYAQQKLIELHTLIGQERTQRLLCLYCLLMKRMGKRKCRSTTPINGCSRGN